jgi:superfamily II DNA/RNA helicase
MAARKSKKHSAFERGGFLTFRDDELPEMPGVLTFNPHTKSWDDAEAAAELVRADANATQIALRIAAAEAAAEGQEGAEGLDNVRRHLRSKKKEAMSIERDVQVFFQMASQAGLQPPARAGTAGTAPTSNAQALGNSTGKRSMGAKGAGGRDVKGRAGTQQASGGAATPARGAYERALLKKLRHIDDLLRKQKQGAALDEMQKAKVSKRQDLLLQLASCQAPDGRAAARHSDQLPPDAVLHSQAQPTSEGKRHATSPVGSAPAAAGGANATGADGLSGRAGRHVLEAGAAASADSTPWAALNLDPRIVMALQALSFDAPTPIQNVSILGINSGRDVIGIAETGAGKTLAYGLPIINHLLSWPCNAAEQRVEQGGDPGARQARERGGRWGLRALIMCPTRELALQVTEHLNSVLKGVWSEAARPKAVALVGGLAEVKQVKQLSKHPAIVVATPGRLWALLQAKEKHLVDGLKSMRFVVLDEGDRLMESGHFKDLQEILKMLPPARKVHIDGKGHAHPVEDDDASDSEDEALDAQGPGEPRQKRVVRQALVFSATFTVPDPLARARPAAEAGATDPEDGRRRGEDIGRGRRALSRGGGRARYQDGRAPHDKEDEGWEGLSFKSAMRAKGKQVRRLRGKVAARNMVKLARKLLKMPAKPLVLYADVLQRAVSSRVKQYVIKCRHEDKDLFLFFFLRNNPGRSIVFVNNISVLRRVAALLQRLKLGARAVHASMQQRARLKSLEHFSADECGVLVATDVAARGLDIPLVQHVIHYDVPSTAEVYTHRSGRAAHQPGSDTGYSVLLADRRDDRMWAKVGNLTCKFAGVKQVGAHSSQFKSLQRSIKLARKLVASVSQLSKRAKEQSWKANMAKELEIEVDAEDDDAPSDEVGSAPAAASERAAQQADVAKLEADLAAELVSLGKASFEDFLAKDAALEPQNATTVPEDSNRRAVSDNAATARGLQKAPPSAAGAGLVPQRKAVPVDSRGLPKRALDKSAGAHAQALAMQREQGRSPRKGIIVGGRSQLDRFRRKSAGKA